MINNWTPVAIIILGYVVGLYFQNRSLDIFREGLYKYLDIRFKSMEDRLTKVEDRLTKLEDNIKVIK